MLFEKESGLRNREIYKTCASKKNRILRANRNSLVDYAEKIEKINLSLSEN